MSHQCYLCSHDNPDRVFDGAVAQFAPRYVGPPERAHGGMSVGALTCPALSQAAQSGMKNPTVKYVSGRLHAPVPLGSPLEAMVTVSDVMDVSLADKDTPIVTGKVSVVDSAYAPQSQIGVVPDHLIDDVKDMSKVVNANLDGETTIEQHFRLFTDAGLAVKNDCYGCSEKPHALKLHNRITENRDLWTRWDVDPDLVDNEGQLATASIVSALDCSNLWVITAQEGDLGLRLAIDDKKMWITGTHSVHFVKAAPQAGDYQVITRFLRRDGRKAFTLAVLFDSNKEVYAVAEAISILIDYLPEMT